MAWWSELLTTGDLVNGETFVSDWVGVATLVLLVAEAIWLAVRRQMSRSVASDAAVNVSTFALFVLVELALGGLVLGAMYGVWATARIATLPMTVGTLLVSILAADLSYYWEHRFSHRVGLAWATHSVHHSSEHFNLTVAIRFGPFDSLVALLFHLPLLIVGFHPVMVLFATLFVLNYQTFLHTEAVGKLPWPIESVFNTPSHHRVHHGSNPAYLDRNYGGIFIVWDRLFGTFAEEQEAVNYGLTRKVDSRNPVVVFLDGYTHLARRIAQTPGGWNKLQRLVRPPEWEPTPTATEATSQAAATSPQAPTLRTTP